MEQKIHIASLSEIDSAAVEFLQRTGSERLIAFYAPMGAGKTTFTVAVCRALGVQDNVCSPTFTIVNEYETADGQRIYHFDFYRIKNDSEAMDIGIEDYFYSGCLCLMEWPENIENLLPDNVLKVKILVNDDDSRDIVWDNR